MELGDPRVVIEVQARNRDEPDRVRKRFARIWIFGTRGFQDRDTDRSVAVVDHRVRRIEATEPGARGGITCCARGAARRRGRAFAVRCASACAGKQQRGDQELLHHADGGGSEPPGGGSSTPTPILVGNRCSRPCLRRR